MKYPFTPEVLDALPEELAELFRSLEDTLLEEICSRLNLSGQLNEVTVQSIRALRAHGIGLDEIEQAIQKTADIGQEKLDRLLQDVVERNQRYYKEVIDLSGVTAPETLLDEALVEAIRRQTQENFRNITRSMGFLVDGGRTVIAPGRAYQWALDNAALEVQSGAVNYNQAIRCAVRQLADSGIKTVNYESGRRDQVDVAVRRAVMTGITQLSAQYSESTAEILQTPLREVSAHIGARDTGVKWQNHKSWQGRVYSVRAGDRYPSIYEVCGLGQVDGLEGANCRHMHYAFVEGVSERAWTDGQLAHIDDGHDVTFEGRHYTAYEATQKQRQIERTVRRLKREKTAFEGAGLSEDAQAANIRIRRLHAEYRAFSKAAGLPEQPERMRAAYSTRLAETRQFSALKEYDGTITVQGKFAKSQYVVDAGKPVIASITKHFSENLAQKADRAGLQLEQVQNIIEKSRLTIYQTDRNVLKFIADEGYAVLGLQRQLVTAVPEKIRKKYRDYLEEHAHGETL